ncbi:hypothetical protein K2173_022873 [Erythroxylum novogranatense]|uniref:MBD domain-containing protein n=1 Tax=Erythroxylum novogranatense TaxID=1862640 RepID=A0AAV8TVP6_9ROSI|nr:hypothetical protein K2173_022873 [Erythroxylum novogranatense]
MQAAGSSTANDTVPPLRPQKKSSDTSSDQSSWLPPGWIVEDRVRTSGVTAGMVDKYYFDPVSGRKFRSKKEVQIYLETGTTRKKKKGIENSDGDINPLESSSQKRKLIEFDYANPPYSVSWVITDADEDTWTPFIKGKRVPEHEKQSWDVEFASLISRGQGNRRF